MSGDSPYLVDALTGLASPRAFDQTLDLLSGRLPEMGCIVLDLDRLKHINDRFQIPAGDQVLCHVATILRLTAPDGATVARIGGDEFAVVLPVTTLSHAMGIAEQIRQTVETGHMPSRGRQDVVTISAGVGVFDSRRHSTANDVVAEAFGLMEKAKANGRNRVVGPPGSR